MFQLGGISATAIDALASSGKLHAGRDRGDRAGAARSSVRAETTHRYRRPPLVFLFDRVRWDDTIEGANPPRVVPVETLGPG